MMTDHEWRLFREPPRRFSPAPIWWWSGDPLDLGRLRWQMDRLIEGGVHQAVILNLAPSGPAWGADPDVPTFQSEAWWEIVRAVCVYARERGFALWFYDQIGFSGANLQAEVARAAPGFAGQWLERVTRDTDGPATLTCPAGGAPVAGCALPLDEHGMISGPPRSVPLTGAALRWPGGGRHRLMLFHTITRGFDYFSPAACQALFARVHGEFAHRLGDFFGSTIVGSFQDELPALPSWSPAFAEEFQRRRGYDARAHLVHLWEDLGPESAAVRADYHATRADLAERAFFRPLHDWHARHGLISSFDQQGPARAGWPVQAIQLYADYLRAHRWFGAPGSDHHGDAKIHSSLAHLYDRPGVWIEAFHSTGWGGTLEETFDWLLPWLRAGATIYNPHAVYYSTHGGWWEWAPPSTCWRQPYWRHYPRFAMAVSRLCALLSQGAHVCDVGVLYPTATVQAGSTLAGPTAAAERAHAAYLALVGHMVWHAIMPGILDRDRRDYDVLDDASAQRATVAAGALVIGAERYRAIVLPACVTLEDATAAALRRFVEAGGLLIAIGAPPETTAGRTEPSAAVQALADLFATGRARLVATPEETPEALAGLPRLVEAPVPTLLRRAGGRTILFVPAAFPGATWQHGHDWNHPQYTFDPERYARTMTLTVRGVKGAPSLWSLTSGERRSLAATPEGDDGVTLTVPFEDAPAALLVWDDDEVERQPVPMEKGVTPGERVGLEGDWEVELVPALDNRWGDLAWPPAPGAPPLQRWRCRYRREGPNEEGSRDGWARSDFDDANWEMAFATFGSQGWWTGPAAPEALPAPLAGPIEAGEVDPLAAAGWRPAVFSLSRGAFRDALHQITLGPKGHVPEEFLDFGGVTTGQAVQARLAFWRDEAADLTLAVGAAAAKTVWLNGQAHGPDLPGYLWQRPARAQAGWNVLEIRLLAERDVWLRAYAALVADPADFQRPEWLAPADEPAVNTLVRFERLVTLTEPARTGHLHLGAAAPARLLVNGREIGRQGGFEPYAGMTSVQPYDIAAALQPGRNSIVVEALDMGWPCAVLVDALLAGADGRERALISGLDWAVTRDGRPVAAMLRREQWLDPAWTHLWRRPHPLPAATWLARSPGAPGAVPLAFDPAPGQRRVEWLRFRLPPGAVDMTLPLTGKLDVFVDGVSTPIEEGKVRLPVEPAAGRVCAVRVASDRGGLGGAILDGPIQFTVGPGRMTTGDWEEQGLADYAGGVCYRRVLDPTPRAGRRAWLDLGRTRGTAEVRVNGQPAGVRIWSPYRFEVTDFLRPGANEIEIEVFNTLAPYLAAVSPTHYVFPGQSVSGLLGPVTLSYE